MGLRLAAAAGAGTAARRHLMRLLWLAVVLASLALEVDGYGDRYNPDGTKKKSKFLINIPMLIKTGLFWWCVAISVIMLVYILDMWMNKRYGNARVTWTAEASFDAATVGRERLWAQLAEPAQWRPSHPILQSASVAMVKVLRKTPVAKKDDDEESEEEFRRLGFTMSTSETDDGKVKDRRSVRHIKCVPMDNKPLSKGLGLQLSYREDAADRGGRFFCTRECTRADTPAPGEGEHGDGVWRLDMRTIEVGAGNAFELGTEESEAELWPVVDGKIRCRIVGRGEVYSRIHRWWSGLSRNAQVSAEAFLEALGTEAESGKKCD